MKRLPILLAVASLPLLAAPSSALAATQIKAVFLKEYDIQTYTIDQGELVTFANQDPFLDHGVASDDLGMGGEPLFSAPVIGAGSQRLLRGAPFLSEGTYPFADPDHPEMTATLEVTADGDPLPPDELPPSATASIRSTTTKKVVGKRKLQVAVNPSEAADLSLTAAAKGVQVATAERTYLSAGKRIVAMRLTKAGARSLASGVATSRKRGARRIKLKLSVAITDVAGNSAAASGSGALRLPKPPRKHRRR